MSSHIKFFSWLITGVLFFFAISIKPSIIFAQVCGSAITKWINGCGDPPNCDPIYSDDQNITCTVNQSQCMGLVETDWCEKISETQCEFHDLLPAYIPCGSIGPGGPGGCTTTAPSITSIQWGMNGTIPDTTKVTINFNSGSGGNRNDIAFGSNKLNVTGKCFGSTSGCTTYTNVTSPLVVNSNLFSNGTVYYFKVWNIAGACTKSSAIKQDISSCEISPDKIPTGSTPFNIGDPSKTLTSEVVSKYVYLTSPTEVKVTFSSGDSDIADVNPSSVINSNSYQTQISPVGAGSTVIRSSVYLDNVLSCTAGDPTEVTVTDTSTPTCTLSLTPANPQPRNEGANPVTFTATVNVTPATATIDSVTFSSSNTNAATFSQSSDGSTPYSRDADIASSVSTNQTTTITASARVNGTPNLCTDTSQLTVNDVTVSGSPWWQAIDGDITSNQEINSDVASGNVLIDDGDSGLPGLAIYSTTINTGSGSSSSKNWSTDTVVTTPRIFNYDYFLNQIPSDVVFNDISILPTGSGSIKSYGYEWYNVTGNYSTTVGQNLGFGNRKIILFVSGDFNINSEIFLADGIGFFGAFVNGSINTLGSITRSGAPSIEGIYLTDEVFSTGAGSSKLWLRGSFIAHQGFNLQRDLVDDTNPSSIFEYGPDLIANFPSILAYKRSKWVEVNP